MAVVQALGALAGWAAGVGVVVLSALYWSHARDVQRLRAWAGGAPERVRGDKAPPRRAAGWAPVLAGLLIAGGLAIYGVGRLGGGDSDGASPKPTPTVVPVKPHTVTVAVLNGTTVDGLAAALRERLAAEGFRKGAIGVFSDQQLAESVVEYAPGRRAAAQAVGRVVGIDRYAPVRANSRALAGAATVIVIAGADKAP